MHKRQSVQYLVESGLNEEHKGLSNTCAYMISLNLAIADRFQANAALDVTCIGHEI